MLGLRLDEAKTILCLGAHSDDIEIGCGGAILSLLNENPERRIYWIVFSGKEKRITEATASALPECREAVLSQLMGIEQDWPSLSASRGGPISILPAFVIRSLSMPGIFTVLSLLFSR